MKQNKNYLKAGFLGFLTCLGLVSSADRAMATVVISGGTWSSYGFGSSLTDPDITISGTLTIDVNAEFLSCPDIKMAAGAQIIVSNGVTFTATSSHFYTPGNYMWEGIMVDGTPISGGTVSMDYTTIEDAIYAIRGKTYALTGMDANYNFDLNHMKFNRNYIAIQKISVANPTNPAVAPTKGYYSGATHKVYNFEITCVDDINAASPIPVNLKPGSYYDKPYAGMVFYRLNNVEIGHKHPLYALGSFRYLNRGIISEDCEIYIAHCSFTDIRNYEGGKATYASIPGSRAAGIFLVYLSVAPISASFPLVEDVYSCTFDNSEWGIAAARPFDLRVISSSFNACGVALEHHYGLKGKVKVDGCSMLYCDNPIISTNNNFNDLSVTNCNISVNFPSTASAPSPYPYVSSYQPYNKGIVISPVTPAASGFNLIDNNTISGGDAGIELNMVEGSVLNNNTLHFQLYGGTGSGLFTYQRHGVYLLGGKGNGILNNSIRGTAGTYTTGTPYMGTTDELQYGLSAYGSPANTISCNNTGDLYAAFHFGGDDANTKLAANNLEASHNFVTGIYMQAWGSGGAVISQQGTTGGAAHFNSFNGNFTYPGAYRTICDASTNGASSPFIYASGTTPTPTPNLGFLIPISTFGTASSSIASILCYPPLRISGDGNMGTTDEPIDQNSLEWAFAVAADSLYGGEAFEDFLRYRSRSFLYAYLSERPTLRATFSALDNFYQGLVDSPIACLYRADSLIRVVGADTSHTGLNGTDSNLINLALLALNPIAPSAPFAGLEAELRSMSWNRMLNDSLEYDSTQKARIESIAALCPGLEGMAVYTARQWVPLWKDTLYSDDSACAASGGAMWRKLGGAMWAEPGLPQSSVSPQAIVHQLIPNPASASTRLQLNQSLATDMECAIYDMKGRCVQRFVLPAHSSYYDIDIHGLSPGLYFYTNTAASLKGKLLVH